MEIMKGYKQTDFGVIPEDWVLFKLGDIGKTFGGLSGKSKDDFNNGMFPYIPFMNIMKNPIIDSDYFDYVTIKPGESQNLALKGDLFFNGSSETPEEVGMCSVLQEDIPNLYLNSFCFGFRLYKDLNINGTYLSYYFRSKEGRKLFYSMAQGATRYNLSKANFNRISIPIPSSEEQTAIAKALSDEDAYITSLEKIIEKKKAIKQGAMQKLLKPKDGWHWVKLGDIGKTFGGLSGKSKDDFKDGVYPYIPFMNIMTNPIIDTEFLDFVNLGKGESQNHAQKGDLFFNGSSETPEEVGMCSILLDEIPNLYLNSFCFGFRLKKELNINGLYLTCFFRSKQGRDLFSSLAQGATRYNLSKANFNKIEVPIPELNEQNFIADALMNMDSEIQLLKEKLKKAKSIKQGMIQKLLTGKIRLI
jgi:type I restriction enzyme S subunit